MEADLVKVVVETVHTNSIVVQYDTFVLFDRHLAVQADVVSCLELQETFLVPQIFLDLFER